MVALADLSVLPKTHKQSEYRLKYFFVLLYTYSRESSNKTGLPQNKRSSHCKQLFNCLSLFRFLDSVLSIKKKKTSKNPKASHYYRMTVITIKEQK